jgi:putative transposase
VPTSVQFELYKWTRRERGEASALEAVALAGQGRVVPLSSVITLLAGDLALDHGLSFADAIIYATARQQRARLLTCDDHFEGLEGVTCMPKRRVLVHSDQGSQYGSDDWVRISREHNLEPSMSRRGNCWDNAVVESFFSSLKKERIKKRVYKTRDLARADTFDYIEMFYYRTRRHSHFGGISPEAFERASL